MARRRIGQERLNIGDRRCGASLDEMSARHLVGIYAAAKGELGWPPLALFRAMLLAVWHDLSDVKLAEALEDRASFRRFCGFSATEPTPERTAFVRFRAELVRRNLDRMLFASITQQLEAKGVVVRTGTLIDATLIASASIHHDNEARWAGHRRRKPVHGYKAHVATDESAGLIRGVEVTSANVHDVAELDAVLPSEPGDVYGDSAFAGSRSEQVMQLMGARHAWCTRAPGVGRSARSSAATQCRRAQCARPYREGVRHLQAQLRAAADALARSGQSGSTGQADRDRLQSAAHLASADATAGMRHSDCARGCASG
jgi:transposase, IS5 family